MRKPIGFTVIASVLLLTLLTSRAWAITVNVCKSGCEYSTIQAGIDAAAYLDTVLVGPGTYKERIVYHGKVITVKSSAGAGSTTIDGTHGGIVVRFDSGSSTAIIQGFTIKNGGGEYVLVGDKWVCRLFSNDFRLLYHWEYVSRDGGGIYASNASIINSTISGNTVVSNDDARGAGIYCDNCSITSSLIESNSTSTFYDPHLSSADWSTYARGGGIYILNGSTITNCTIRGNIASS